MRVEDFQAQAILAYDGQCSGAALSDVNFPMRNASEAEIFDDRVPVFGIVHRQLGAHLRRILEQRDRAEIHFLVDVQSVGNVLQRKTTCQKKISDLVGLQKLCFSKWHALYC